MFLKTSSGPELLSLFWSRVGGRSSRMRPNQQMVGVTLLFIVTVQLAAAANVPVLSLPAIRLADQRNSLGNLIPRFRGGSNLNLRGGEFTSPLPIASGDSFKSHSAEGTVTIKFSIRYGLDNGVIVVCGPHTKFGNNDPNRAPKMQKKAGDLWELTIQVPLEIELVTYNYIVLSNTRRKESQINARALSLRGAPDGAQIEVQDMFRSPKAFSLATSCFSRAIFGRGFAEATAATENKLAQAEELVWAAPPSSDQARSGDSPQNRYYIAIQSMI